MSLNIKGWPAGHATHGLVTLTRFTDHARNSDKYRRFIVLWDPADTTRKILITHTGRWTGLTAAGDWSGGTYRFQKDATNGTDKRRSPEQFLQAMVSQKKGSYDVKSTTTPATGHLAFVYHEVQNQREVPMDTGQPNAPRPGSGPKPDLAGAVAAARRPSLAAMPTDPLQQPHWLIEAASQGTDQLELLGLYSGIAEQMKREAERVAAAQADLATALTVIMSR